jgi:hypothetical protein
MTTRTVGPAAGFNWVRRAINLGAGNPMAVFGGAALFLVAIIGAAIPLSLLVGVFAANLQPGGVAALLLSLAITLPILLLAACLMVGYLRVIDAVEGGRPASALDTFRGFGDLQTALRAFLLLLALAVVQNALIAGIVMVFSPGLAAWYAELMQAQASGEPPTAMAMTPPDGSGFAILLAMLMALLVYAVQSIGLCQVILRGRGLGAALSDGATGAVRNLLALLVLAVVAIAAAIAAGIALVLVALVVGLLSNLLGSWIAVVLGVPLYIVLLVAVVVVSFGVMYHLWRDVAGGPDAAAPLPADSVEL